jgi:hypothetical protein
MVATPHALAIAEEVHLLKDAVQVMLSPPSSTEIRDGRRTFKAITCGDNALHYGAGSYFIASIEVPVFGRISEASRQKPFLGVAVNFDSDKIAGLLIALPDSE